MNHRELIKELLKLSDEALKEIGKEGLAVNREVAEGWVKGDFTLELRYGAGKWVKHSSNPTFSNEYEWRIKPRTINIHGHEVPEPVRNPKHGDRVFYYNGIDPIPIYRGYDAIRISHIKLRDRGVLFLSSEDCQRYIDAILSFTKEKS